MGNDDKVMDKVIRIATSWAIPERNKYLRIGF
jgi:hypothetical protein